MSQPAPSTIPLLPLEKKIRNHATLCAVGFLILLPIGALVGRYLRTFTSRWFWGHWVIQFLVAGPVILTGWAFGYRLTADNFTGHWNDPHKKTGLALLILYIIQVLLGAIIHFFKTPYFFSGRRPPQNYLHATIGLAIIALAFYQVHYGITFEWYELTGGLHVVPHSVMSAWIAVAVVFWTLYVIGLALLPRQYKIEAVNRSQNGDEKLGSVSTASNA
ncbi:hypothetical protein BD410DRAFT_792984 [Rickenella mellea]|uniref:Cytochrome b561 domain-containing protein n=1 Tax=Rickenella mellea TaxID=50990 RepID=A0A4Y7PUL2_9AGAM|nr:hypothetical protein BD410DRAFT_792984 [Rickenella mellea]